MRRHPESVGIVAVFVQKTEDQVSKLLLPARDIGPWVAERMSVIKLQKPISITGQ
jgi:hypothetical protein